MDKMSFEEALKKLELITRELENGEVDLDASIEKYKEATKLMEYCSKKLDDAQKTVAKIMGEDGNLTEFKEE